MIENHNTVIVNRLLPENYFFSYSFKIACTFVLDNELSETAKKIEESAQNDNVPLLHFNDTSVTLGKLCGLQFRVSVISLNSTSNTNIQAILKEYEKK